MNHVTPELSLFYDGACAICRKYVTWLKKRTGERIHYVDISGPEFAAESFGLDKSAVLQEIHAIESDGTTLKGIPAIQAVFNRAGLGRLGRIISWPLLRPIFGWFYRKLALNRYLLFGTTGRRGECGGC
jgi:predicted DCC family thiol-disulfide oxidoreductase YuxK